MGERDRRNDEIEQYVIGVGSEGYGFDRTVVPVFLAQYENEKLVSRSQARRLLARVNRFKEVVLDFDKVDFIGQAFADEIFRIFQSEHPGVRLTWLNENEEIRKMIQRAQAANPEGPETAT